MRKLTEEEIRQALEDTGETDEGAVAVETTIQELADLGAGTYCGIIGNACFKALADKGYGHLKCRGWYLAATWILPPNEPSGLIHGYRERNSAVTGMFHIEIQDVKAEDVEDIVSEAHGSLRSGGKSKWDGFAEFEVE